MEWAGLKHRTTDFLQKYKYVALILLLGIGLMILPVNKKTTETVHNTVPQEMVSKSAEERLEEILSQIAGAGKVRVLLTEAAGNETIYQTDEDMDNNADSSGVRKDTVTVTSSDRNESGLVRQINPPVYRGAVIVCQGADQASVRLSIVDAVSKVTGLGADQISVLKMK